MWLGGSPEDIRRHAARLRAHAEGLADERIAARLRLDGVQWESLAAQSFRAQSLADFDCYDRAIAQVVDAAGALDRLADELGIRQRKLAAIAEQIGRSVQSLWNDARSVGEDVLSFAEDALGAVSGGLL